MNASAFSELVKTPALLRNYSISELQELSQQYAYSPLIYSLIALKAHMEGDSDYEHYLNRAAIRVPDRKRLYHLIHANYEEQLTEIAENSISEQVAETEPELSEKAETSGVRETITEPVERNDNVFSEPEPELSAKTEPVQNEEAVTERMAQDDNIFSEQELLASADFEKVDDISGSEKEEKAAEEKPIELPGMEDVLQALKSLQEQAAPEVPKQEATEVKRTETESEPPPAAGGEHSFTEWLSLIKQGKNLSEPRPPVIEPDLTEEKFEFEREETSEEEKDIDAIIIGKQAKASLADDEELVTETLAKIYEMQGKTEKAVKAYQKLGLKYPEKSTYFADKIRELKNK